MEAEASEQSKRFRLLNVSEVINRPSPHWLVAGLISIGVFIGVYGPPGEGKSFLALDWALHIACGGEWNGLPVEQGAVVYVAAEGDSGIGKRIRAWLQHHRVGPDLSAFFLLEPVQVRDSEDLDVLLERIEESRISPRLIVIDTLARCFVGGDENAASDMGQFVEGVRRLQTKTNAAVMVVHHAGKAAKGGRPFTEAAVRAAVDRAARTAGLRRRGPHMLRHTFCSHLAMNGAQPQVIQAFAGHQNVLTTQRYTHLSPAVQQQAIQLLEQRPTHARGDSGETAKTIG